MAARLDALLTLWRLVACVRRQRTIPAAVKLELRSWALAATAALQDRPLPAAGRLDQDEARAITWLLLDALDAAGIPHADVAAFFNSHARKGLR
ncbi:hypothetical protein SAMN06265365_1692 [Tistlia consotensis]|uniref:hypothetical protein n=1 Tax=Tistlia consotensis TaxID=1321365 RepID=UPI000B6CC583|nr:hypothetical protein [Tistlia consotensis]SNS40490.1 hypothetical protein SAMN06265365_1692 [Tistlia consotensis]